MSETLFESMCRGCIYQMQGAERGCVKFSHTAKEINEIVYIHYANGQEGRLTEDTPCKVYKGKQ